MEKAFSKGISFGEGSLQSYDFMEKALKGFPFGKGSFVKVIGFPHGKGSLQRKGACLWKMLVGKECPFGEGSLQSYVFMEKALCKGISLLLGKTRAPCRGLS